MEKSSHFIINSLVNGILPLTLHKGLQQYTIFQHILKLSSFSSNSYQMIFIFVKYMCVRLYSLYFKYETSLSLSHHCLFINIKCLIADYTVNREGTHMNKVHPNMILTLQKNAKNYEKF